MDEALKERLEEQRHQELLEAINLLAPAIQKSHSELRKFIDQNKDLISGFISKLSEFQKPDAPKVSVETNQEQVVAEIKTLRHSIDSLVPIMKELLEEEKKTEVLPEWQFDLVKNGYGVTTQVKAKRIK